MDRIPANRWVGQARRRRRHRPTRASTEGCPPGVNVKVAWGVSPRGIRLDVHTGTKKFDIEGRSRHIMADGRNVNRRSAYGFLVRPQHSKTTEGNYYGSFEKFAGCRDRAEH